MSTEIDDINEIIIHYLDGSADLKEKTFLLQWLKLSDNNRNDFIIIRDLWLTCDASVSNEVEVDIALAKLKERILPEQEQTKASSRPDKKKLSSLLRWAQVAAAVLLLVGIGYGLGVWREYSSQDIVVLNQLITAKGSKGQFTLPDGSVVWLNSESKMTFPNHFAGNKRLVTLEGEAYFEVVKDTKKPFIIQTENVDIEVLGTSFNVDSYSSSEFFKTALINGSVKLSGEALKEPIYLKPNELFEFRKTENRISVATTKVGLYTDWIKDRLVFDNDYLADILISMEGRYNMDIECPRQIATSTRASLTIRQENLEEVLDALSIIIPIQYEIEGRKVTIKSKK